MKNGTNRKNANRHWQREKWRVFGEDEKQHLYHIIGMGALKYFLLKVDPKKRLLFDPNESVDFQGTYRAIYSIATHARIRSVLNKAGNELDTNQSKY